MILKAGVILIKDNQICLVNRKKYNDYSFPKGHLEKNESLLECAIRETNEETKREVKIIDENPVYIEDYLNAKKKACRCYYYLGYDNGHSDNTSTDTHKIVWVNFDEVCDKLSYESLKKVWNSIKDKVKYCIEENK